MINKGFFIRTHDAETPVSCCTHRNFLLLTLLWNYISTAIKKQGRVGRDYICFMKFGSENTASWASVKKIVIHTLWITIVTNWFSIINFLKKFLTMWITQCGKFLLFFMQFYKCFKTSKLARSCSRCCIYRFPFPIWVKREPEPAILALERAAICF
jgi:hypothetical protein